MNKRQISTVLWATLGACLALFVYGFIDNLKGATLPLVLSDLSFNYSQGGAIQQGAYLGFLIAAVVASLLVMRLGHRNVLIISAAFLFTGMLGYSFFSSFTILLISMIAIGLGMGTLDLVGVRLIVDYRPSNKGQFLNLSAFFHGLASMLAPIFSGVILASGFRWRNVYHFGIIFVIIFVIFFLVSRIPRIDRASISPADRTRQILNSFRDKRMWLFYILIICYVAVENGFAVWIVEYLQKARLQSTEISIAFLSAFFFFIMTGRLLGSFFVEKIGYLRLLLVASIGATACLILGIFGRSPFLMYFLPLTGLFLSIIFPTTTAAASDDMQGEKDVQFGIFFTLAGLGGIIGAWVIGLLSDAINLQIGFAFLILMITIVMALIITRMRLASHR